MRRTIVLMSLFLAGAAFAATTAASAQENNCLAEVDRLASSLGMKGEASPQATVPRSGASSESLAQSGGVIQPPDVGSARVLEPPKGTADGMNTAPAMPQQDGAPQGTVPADSLAPPSAPSLKRCCLAPATPAARATPPSARNVWRKPAIWRGKAVPTQGCSRATGGRVRILRYSAS